MKKLHLLLALCTILLVPIVAWGIGRLEPMTGTIIPQFTTTTVVVSDTAVSAVPIFLQCIMLTQNDAAPTAGSLVIYDNASAASGTVVFNHTFTTAVFMPVQICPQRQMANGIYADFTTTGDVNLIMSVR